MLGPVDQRQARAMVKSFDGVLVFLVKLFHIGSYDRDFLGVR